MPSYLSDSEIELTTILLLIFCANEFFSIFWENLPRCGLNLPKGIRDFITGVKEIKPE
jgi:phage-related holin